MPASVYATTFPRPNDDMRGALNAKQRAFLLQHASQSSRYFLRFYLFAASKQVPLFLFSYRDSNYRWFSLHPFRVAIDERDPGSIVFMAAS